MRPPSFWHKTHGREAAIMLRTLLSPIAALYDYFTQKRIREIEPAQLSVPVISIGNLTLGGTGKTPTAALLAKKIENAAIVSRGFGGVIKDPTIVNPITHNAKDVGDEPLMLAQNANVIIGRDRLAAAKLAIENGAKAIIIDDGHQNPMIKKDLSIILIDGGVGFGNGHIFPSGPLREKPETGLKRADAIIWIGDKKLYDETITNFDGKVYFAQIKPKEIKLDGEYIAFCGIGRPEKFHDSLKEIGANIIDLIPYSDHHFYTEKDIALLKAIAKSRGAKLITTEKDYIKLSPKMRDNIETLPIEIVFDDDAALNELLMFISG